MKIKELAALCAVLDIKCDPGLELNDCVHNLSQSPESYNNLRPFSASLQQALKGKAEEMLKEWTEASSLSEGHSELLPATKLEDLGDESEIGPTIAKLNHLLTWLREEVSGEEEITEDDLP